MGNSHNILANNFEVGGNCSDCEDGERLFREYKGEWIYEGNPFVKQISGW